MKKEQKEKQKEIEIENKKINYKLRVLLLAFYLIVFSVIVIVFCGQSYTKQYKRITDISNINDLEIIIRNDDEDSDIEVAKCVDKRLDDGIVTIKYKSVNEGIAVVDIKNKNTDKLYFVDYLYVHKSGVLTYNSIMGDTTGSRVIPISLSIWLIYICYILIKAFRNSVKENLYQYKNIVYFGFLLFLIYGIIDQLIVGMSSNYAGLIHTITSFITLSYTFSYLALPLAFITAVFITISNIVLIRKEGFSFVNILGLITGLVFCIVTIMPGIIDDILLLIPWIDVHNDQQIGMYIQMLFEVGIYGCVSYFECVLIGTIIMGIISAKHIPKYDKDYILILGCQIRKDGTLTNLLKSRVDRAIEFAKMQKEATGKDIIFVPSGGKGNDEIISEAEAMKNYLIENGINEKNILIEDKSKNTFENIGFSNKIIKSKKKNAVIAFSTTNYHVLRAGSIATDQKIIIEGIGAKTKSYFWLNAFIREYIATLYTERKRHFVMIGAIMIMMINMIGLLYLSNIL